MTQLPNMTKKDLVESLALSNQKFYGSSDGSGVLRALDLTFPNPWTYLFELAQNALDAKANAISLRCTDDGSTLIFQHNGSTPIAEKDVEGLSKVFRSTKGAASVGFMGIGFKSVFRCYGEARISGWGWAFRYEVPLTQGEQYGDVQRDLLGTVIPRWDESIEAPEEGYTTRFELRHRLDETGLQADLDQFLPEDDRTLLAIMAASGVTRLDMDGHVWELGVIQDPLGGEEAVAISEGEDLIWQLFSVQFKPSKNAIARLLEHRRIQPSSEEREQVYKAAARPRRVLGVLPLDHNGVPNPPKRGRVYATLPTEVTLPFGLYINADWLLDISRNGLMDVQQNAWQRDIVDHIADVLAKFLRWIPHASKTAGNRPAFARSAFAAISLPSADGDGLERLIAENQWLCRLQQQIADSPMLPVLIEGDAVNFTKPGEAIIPPKPLADAFNERPDLQPAVLLNGPVLAHKVLGSEALKLLNSNNFLAEMSPHDLEQSWVKGLEHWWMSLSEDESTRRNMLFHIWGAMAGLATENDWPTGNLRCVRTTAGKWISVTESAFVNEAVPSGGEPGGEQTMEFIDPFLPHKRLPDSWIHSLRQIAGREGSESRQARARGWIEQNSRSISLGEVLTKAMENLVASQQPDWLVLVPVGHWIRNRQRDDLLTHVLVESDEGQVGVPTTDALLVEPYVEYGQARRQLFPTLPWISSAYLSQDLDGANVPKWRSFFERAGAKGALEVREILHHASRGWSGRQQVAEFLGIDASYIRDSNNTGYTLLDFDIAPALPDSSKPERLHALASWLESGYSALQEGLRRVRYHYYSDYDKLGTKPSSWVIKLSQLNWVPCNDDQLRAPKDVIPNPEPAREDAPVAKLSSSLIAFLEQKGVKFGTAIPEASSLRKLLALKNKIGSTELGLLLREVREEIQTDEDREHFKSAVADLTVPSDDGKRVPLQQIVRRTGGGELRGVLGGWILPLTSIQEGLRKELEHPDFPHTFPETTTGTQALGYIRHVWDRAQPSPVGLASEVGDVLPMAYAYILADCDENVSLKEQWAAATPEARVFADGKWVALTDDEGVYFDDLEDRRFLPNRGQLHIVTPGHLGNSASDRLRTAEALGLSALSSHVEMDWRDGTPVETTTDWVRKFDLICKLLRHVRSSGATAQDGSHDELRIRRVDTLNLVVRVGDIEESVSVDARLHNGSLTIAGKPIQFGSDAAKELVRHFSFGQRGDLAADLTGMLGAIDWEQDFRLAVEKFVRSFAKDFELPVDFVDQPPDAELPDEGTHLPESEENPVSSISLKKENDQVPSDGDTLSSVPLPPDHHHRPGSSGSFSRDRALSPSRALAENMKKLKDNLKGEIVPVSEDGGLDDSNASLRASRNGLGDEDYRKAAEQYELDSGRQPEIGDPSQTGWDLRSIDPDTGSKRLIEVKGRAHPWVDDEVIELSRAQVRKAFESLDGSKPDWYLYVVEQSDDGSYRVFPIPNPVGTAAKWMLSGQPWREVAEDSRCIVLHKGDQQSESIATMKDT